jgi:uncharacterized protein (TIGR02145 family)
MKQIFTSSIFILIVALIGCKKSEDGKVEVVPLAPSELKATVFSKDQIDLSWKDNSTNETGYKIERKTDSGVFTEIGSSNTDITTYSDKTVSLNTNYTYRVYSFNQVGKSINYSNEVSIKTLNIPTLTTTALSNITSNGFKSGGNISSDGGSTIISRGIVWDINSNPTITLNTKTSDGTGIGAFQSVITGLALGTKYYVRSYATNNAGTAYGNEISFTTINIPTLTTTAITNINSNSAISGGNISSDGGSLLIYRGVVWGNSNNPTISLGTKTIDGTGTGSFISAIVGLESGTKYYVRSYATNNAGTAYGNEISFTTTSCTICTVIGANGRIWMDRNLGASRVATRYNDTLAHGDLYQWGRRSDGHQKRNSTLTSTLSKTDQPGNGSFIVTSSANPQDWRSPQNNNLWQGVNGVNNPCPTGFRIPTKEEWDAEISSWKSKDSAGAFDSPLKLSVTSYRSYNNGEIWDNNVSGLGIYWTSTVIFVDNRNQSIAVGGLLRDPSKGVAFTDRSTRANGYCVRCIKD